MSLWSYQIQRRTRKGTVTISRVYRVPINGGPLVPLHGIRNTWQRGNTVWMGTSDNIRDLHWCLRSGNPRFLLSKMDSTTQRTQDPVGDWSRHWRQTPSGVRPSPGVRWPLTRKTPTVESRVSWETWSLHEFWIDQKQTRDRPW